MWTPPAADLDRYISEAVALVLDLPEDAEESLDIEYEYPPAWRRPRHPRGKVARPLTRELSGKVKLPESRDCRREGLDPHRPPALHDAALSGTVRSPPPAPARHWHPATAHCPRAPVVRSVPTAVGCAALGAGAEIRGRHRWRGRLSPAEISASSGPRSVTVHGWGAGPRGTNSGRHRGVGPRAATEVATSWRRPPHWHGTRTSTAPRFATPLHQRAGD